MAKRKLTQAELLRGVNQLIEYPAVLLPVKEGGFSVVFPNFAKLTAYGSKREQALQAGQDMLSAHLQGMVAEGDTPPKPSDPARLIPDEDEPLGTELVSIKPDRKAILKRLGLEKNKDKGLALAHLGRLGK
jgi:predicted RNase H-like HicB family nuclease